jgi:hypothetical protein
MSTCRKKKLGQQHRMEMSRRDEKDNNQEIRKLRDSEKCNREI